MSTEGSSLSNLVSSVAVFEQAPVPYHILDHRGIILAVNQTWRELLGWTSQEVVGQGFVEMVFGPDQEQMEETLSEAQGGESVRFSGSLNAKDGSRVLVKLHGRGGIITDHGDPISFWCTAPDAGKSRGSSALEKSTMEQILEHLPAAVSIKDAQEEILFVNRRFAEIIQRQPEELIGLNSAEITPPDLLEQYHRENLRVLSGESVREESEFPGPEGSTFWITDKFPIPQSDGSTLVGSISSEITERVQAEQRLERIQGQMRESEAKFRQLAEHAQDMIVLFDPEYRVQYLNPAAERILGYQKEDFQDQDVFDVIHPGDVAELRQKIQENIREKKSSDLKSFRILGSQGECVWCEAATSYEYDKGGALQSVLVNARDVTRRKELEQDLRESEERFRGMFESEEVGVAISRQRDGVYLEANPGFVKMSGYEYREIIGKSSQALNFISPEQRDQLIQDLESQGSLERQELTYPTKQGEKRTVLYSLNPINLKGEDCFLVTMVDITEQKQVEEVMLSSRERFRSNYQKTPVMMHSIDREGRLVQVSDYWLKVMGYQRSEVVGRRSTAFLTEESQRYAREVALPQFFEKGEAWDVHYQFVTKAGKVLDVLMSAVAEYDQQGEYVRSLAVMEDVTERFAIQRQLQESEQKYRRLVDNTPDIFYIYSLDRGALFWSKQIQEILGFHPDDLLINSWKWDQAIHPDDRALVMETLHGLQPGDSYALEYRVFDQEGVQHWLLDRSVSVREHQGEILIEGLAKDITPRKQLEIIRDLRLLLVENRERMSVEELLRLALDKAEEVTESWIGFCHVLEADEQTIRLQTWSTHTETVVCASDSHEQHFPVPEAGVWAEAIRQRQPVIHNDYESLENKHGMPEGHAHLVRELVVPIFRQDTIVAVFGLGNKPTPYSKKDLELVSQIAEHTWDVVGQKQVQAELKKSESRYRGIVEDQVELICRYTPEGNLTFVNQAYADFFGYSAEELIGFNLFNLMPEEERNWVRQKYLDLTPDDSETRYRHQVYAADGSLRWMEWTDRAIYDSRGELVEYQSVGYDIHEQVILERALKKREEEYQELVGYLQQSREEERSLLASEIHDSLGQSLTVLRFDLDWVLSRIPEGHQEVSDRLRTMMDTVRQTISQVRKIGVGLRPDLLENLGLVAALDWLLDNFGERSDLVFRLEVTGREERLDPRLEVDIFRLAQEAVTNVARHAEAEEVELGLHIGEKAVHLEVKDDGKGITLQTAVGPESFGLVSMRERTRRWDGDFAVRKNEQGGTTLNAEFSREGLADD